jgi:DNA-binding MarR family transcriptional regulator
MTEARVERVSPSPAPRNAATAGPLNPLQTAIDLRAVIAKLMRRFREAGADGSLTPSQASALARLGKGGVSTVSALAALEKVRPQSMAATIEALEVSGFVARSQDPSDGRRQLVRLTEAGAARFEDQREAGAAWLEDALATLAPDELTAVATATALLERVLA